MSGAFFRLEVKKLADDHGLLGGAVRAGFEAHEVNAGRKLRYKPVLFVFCSSPQGFSVSLAIFFRIAAALVAFGARLR